MTRTPEQWLALPKAELDVALAEALREKPWKHNLVLHGSYDLSRWECRKCKLSFEMDEVKSAEYTGSDDYDWCEGATKKPCSVPDPIDSEDWNVAKHWQGKCTIRVFEKHATDVIRVSTCTPGLSVIDAMRVLSLMCRPVDAKIPLIAAAMAVERNKDGR